MPNGEHVPGYTVVNLGVSQDFALPWAGGFTARFDVINVFDKEYESRDGSGEGEEEQVALCVDLAASVRIRSLPQDAPVIRKDLAVSLPELLDQARRPLDVGERKVTVPEGSSDIEKA